MHYHLAELCVPMYCHFPCWTTFRFMICCLASIWGLGVLFLGKWFTPGIVTGYRASCRPGVHYDLAEKCVPVSCHFVCRTTFKFKICCLARIWGLGVLFLGKWFTPGIVTGYRASCRPGVHYDLAEKCVPVSCHFVCRATFKFKICCLASIWELGVLFLGKWFTPGIVTGYRASCRPGVHYDLAEKCVPVSCHFVYRATFKFKICCLASIWELGVLFLGKWFTPGIVTGY